MSAPSSRSDGRAFEREDLTGARFTKVQLNNARFRMVDLSGVVMRDVSLIGASIDGAELDGLLVDGIEIAPLVAAERRRRDPLLAWRDAQTPDELRSAWETIQQGLAATEDRATTLPTDQVHRSVDGEWSFVQTLRHLIFVTDAWLGAILGTEQPFHPWGLPFSDLGEFFDRPLTDLGIDTAADPTLDEILPVRRARRRAVANFLATVDQAQLAEEVNGPFWENGERLGVLRCLRVIFNEECEHRRFAERDLDVLAGLREARS